MVHDLILNLAIKHDDDDEICVAVLFMVPGALLEACMTWRNKMHAQLVKDLEVQSFILYLQVKEQLYLCVFVLKALKGIIFVSSYRENASITFKHFYNSMFHTKHYSHIISKNTRELSSWEIDPADATSESTLTPRWLSLIHYMENIPELNKL